MVRVWDGQYVYVYSNVDGEQQASRSQPNPLFNVNPFDAQVKLMTDAREDSDVHLQTEEQVDGRPSYVIEVVPKTPTAAVRRRTLWYDKQTGVLLKRVDCGNTEGETTTTRVTKVELDNPLPGEVFVFKVPAGVPVRDQGATDNRFRRVASPASQPGLAKP